MAVLNLFLTDNQVYEINENNADSTNTVNISAIGNSSIIANGVDVNIASLAGVEVASSPTFIAKNGGTMILNQGLLNVSALSTLTFGVQGTGDVILDGSTITTGLTHLLSSYTVTYEGDAPGSFTYNPSGISLLDPANFTVTGMQPGDEFNIGGNRNWALDTTTLGGPRTAYRNGFLHIESNSLLGQNVSVRVPMTQSEADTFFANQPTYFNPSRGVFVFPGDIMCFGQGSLLLTDSGYRPVEELRAGDTVVLATGARDQIRWIGSGALDSYALDLLPNMRPIRLQRDCLAPGYPFADLIVSPQHRVLVNSSEVRALNDGAEGLIAAKHLVGIPGIEVARNMTSVRYYHVLLSRHEVLFANGLPTESFLIGPRIARHLAPSLREDILRQVPEVRTLLEQGGEKSRHSLLKGKVARTIGKAHGYRADAFFNPSLIIGRGVVEPA